MHAGINSAVFFAFFEALRTVVKQRQAMEQLQMRKGGGTASAASVSLGSSSTRGGRALTLPVTESLLVEEMQPGSQLALASATVSKRN